MRIPEFLKENGTIGFVAPSYGCNIEPYKSAFENAQKQWEKRGYQLELGPNCYEGCGIGISNTPQKCGEELNEFFIKKDAEVLISCGGGELMCEVLDYVDFDAIREHKPKWYMGYSDNTNMTFLLPTLCDTAAVYAPCAPAFGMEPWHPALEDAFGILTGECSKVTGYDKWEKESLKTEENPVVPYNTTEEKVVKSFLPLSILSYSETEESGLEDSWALENGGWKLAGDEEILIEGRLIGGCLDCLSNLVGTKYDKVKEFNERYQKDGIIWFMESCDLNVMGIRRAIWQLQHAGWFQYVKGFLIGRPLCFGEEMFGLDQYRAVTDLLSEYQVPIIMDIDLGHLPPMMPVVSGAKAKVVVKRNAISLEYDFSS